MKDRADDIGFEIRACVITGTRGSGFGIAGERVVSGQEPGGALGEVRRAIEARFDAEMTHQGAWHAYMRGDGYENERRLKDAEERMGAAKAALESALAAVEARLAAYEALAVAADAYEREASDLIGILLEWPEASDDRQQAAAWMAELARVTLRSARAALTAEDVG